MTLTPCPASQVLEPRLGRLAAPFDAAVAQQAQHLVAGLRDLADGDRARRDDAVVGRRDVRELRAAAATCRDRRARTRAATATPTARRVSRSRSAFDSKFIVAKRLAALERRLRVRELGFALLQRRLLRRDFGFEQRRRQHDEPLPFLHAIADVDEHFGDAVAADLGRDDDVLPRIARSRSSTSCA